MLYVEENRIYMTRGDYGLPLPIALVPCCEESGIDLLESDSIRLQIEKGNRVYAERTATWGEIQKNSNTLLLKFTQAESEEMLPGVYIWRVRVYRNDSIQATLLRSTLEVVY